MKRWINDLSIEKREADEKLARLQADLVVQRSRGGELDQLWPEFKATESLLRQELSQARGKLEDSELEKKDSELHVASKRLEGLNKGAMAELDCERIVFRSKKNGLLRELKQALTDKAETKKQADEDVARLQKEVKVFKLKKYRGGYNNGAQGTTPRYPLKIRSLYADQGTVEALTPCSFNS